MIRSAIVCGPAVRYTAAAFDTRRTVGGRTYVHHATDFFAPEGAHVHCPTGGKVTGRAERDSDAGGYWLTVVGDDGEVHYFAHFLERAFVEVGERVRVGQLVGLVGRTGNTDDRQAAAHCHYSVKADRTPYNAFYAVQKVQQPKTTRPYSHNGPVECPEGISMDELAKPPAPPGKKPSPQIRQRPRALATRAGSKTPTKARRRVKT